ncbi:MAG: hypothetical protein IJA61_01460 [Clostridia bacterium]|nr:hypothetical protein [Clostridia bacterium]
MNYLFEYFQEKNKKYIKNDLHIYSKTLQDRLPDKNDEYIMIGYYNADKTRFKDILTGKVIGSADVENAVEIKSSGVGIYSDDKIECTHGYFPEIKFAFYNNRGILSQKGTAAKGMEAFFNFYNKQPLDAVSTKELRKVAKELNRVAYNHELSLYQSNIEQHNVEKIREGYSKEF